MTIAMDSGLASRIKQFDAYPKTLEDFRVKTFGGAVGKEKVSIVLFNMFMNRFPLNPCTY